MSECSGDGTCFVQTGDWSGEGDRDPELGPPSYESAFNCIHKCQLVECSVCKELSPQHLAEYAGDSDKWYTSLFGPAKGKGMKWCLKCDMDMYCLRVPVEKYERVPLIEKHLIIT